MTTMVTKTTPPFATSCEASDVLILRLLKEEVYKCRKEAKSGRNPIRQRVAKIPEFFTQCLLSRIAYEPTRR